MAEAIPLAALEAGDVATAAGDTVPADGTLLDAPALLEEALLTGESRPVERQAGETVLAGSIAHQRPLRMRVTATGTGTRLSHLIRLVEDAQAHRPPLARMADRIAAWFVVGMLLAAAAVYVAWRVHDPSRAFEVALAFAGDQLPVRAVAGGAGRAGRRAWRTGPSRRRAGDPPRMRCNASPPPPTWCSTRPAPSATGIRN